VCEEEKLKKTHIAKVRVKHACVLQAHTCLNTYIYVYVHVHIYMHNIHTYLQIYKYTYITYTHTYTYKYIHVCVKNTQTCAHTWKHTKAHLNAHILTHTHLHTLSYTHVVCIVFWRHREREFLRWKQISLNSWRKGGESCARTSFSKGNSHTIKFIDVAYFWVWCCAYECKNSGRYIASQLDKMPWSCEILADC